MTYKEELERRNRANQHVKKQSEAEAAARNAKRSSRAKEVVQHLEQQKASELGIIIEHRDTRIILRTSATSAVVRIDVDVDKYAVAVDAPTRAGHFPETVRGTTKALRSLDELDAYILNFCEKYGL